MTERQERLQKAREFVLGKVKTMPRYVLTLGSGLSEMVETMEKETEFALSEIPYLRVPTVKGHAGKVSVGKLGGVRVLAMQGRLHCYEGYPMEDVVFPFRVFGTAGAEYFFLTNAAGGLDPRYVPSDLVLIRDHINLMGDNPLIGPNDDTLGVRFPDLTRAYDKELGDFVIDYARRKNIALYEGVYLANPGPSYETPAEVRMYRNFGAHLVGMSTVPEVIALRHMGKKILGVSCVTNLAAGISDEPLDHSDVMHIARKAYPKLSELFQAALRWLEEVKR